MWRVLRTSLRESLDLTDNSSPFTQPVRRKGDHRREAVVASINTRGIIVGGLAAGLIINISEYILNEPVLGARMTAAMAAHNLPPIGGSAIAGFVILGFVLGLVLVWVYAAIRPRFGAGPRTAAIAGVVVWFLDYFSGAIGFGALGLFSRKLILVALAWGFVEMVVAALVGARLYSEP
jgi:hypothetical protein